MIDITALKGNAELIRKASIVTARAFLNEGFTSRLFNLSDKRSISLFTDAFELKMQVYAEAGQPVFAAVKNEEVLGAAVLKRPDFSPAVGATLRIIMPDLLRLLPLLRRFHFRLGLRARKALAIPSTLPKPYYSLEAIGVNPKYQGNGVGRLLLEHVQRVCKADKNSEGTYLVTADRKNSSIYEHFGYRTVTTKDAFPLEVFHMFRNTNTKA